MYASSFFIRKVFVYEVAHKHPNTFNNGQAIHLILAFYTNTKGNSINLTSFINTLSYFYVP